MKLYKSVISLSKNERGIWDLDTIKGCKSGLEQNENGCYNDCYAYKTAKRYGIDFSKSVERNFVNEKHRKQIVKKIEQIDMPFIRIGCSGDPSENWEHTINIIEAIRNESQLSLFEFTSMKQVVIITRHWNVLTENQLNRISKFNVCINTSISAMDGHNIREKCYDQYVRLKPYCKSVLRVVTCDFNLNNEVGKKMAFIQNNLISENGFIDTVFRPSKSNPLVANGIINTSKMAFMKTKSLVSKMNKRTFLGKCSKCLELCGLNSKV